MTVSIGKTELKASLHKTRRLVERLLMGILLKKQPDTLPALIVKYWTVLCLRLARLLASATCFYLTIMAIIEVWDIANIPLLRLTLVDLILLTMLVPAIPYIAALGLIWLALIFERSPIDWTTGQLK